MAIGETPYRYDELIWQSVTPTFTITTGTGTTSNIPFNASVNFEGMLATKEDYLQLVKMLSTCCLCGAEDCFVVCDLCKTAIVEVRNRMVGEMIEELRPHCA